VTAVKLAAPLRPPAPTPASVDVLTAILEYYGFDYFFERTLRTINLKDEEYADAVDEAIERYRSDGDLNAFSLRRAFRSVVDDLMDEEDLTYAEALEILASDDYVVCVSTALYYSVDAGETDIEYLSTLIRNRAQRLLRQQAQRTPS
jgi:hypothetical protein